MKIFYVLQIYSSVPVYSKRQNKIISKADSLKMQIEKYIPSTILKEKPLVDLLLYNIMEQSEDKIFKAYVKEFKTGKNSKNCIFRL